MLPPSVIHKHFAWMTRGSGQGGVLLGNDFKPGKQQKVRKEDLVTPLLLSVGKPASPFCLKGMDYHHGCRTGQSAGVKVEKQTSHDSLYWFLLEPVVHGARLSLTEGGARSLSESIRKAGVFMVRHLVEIAGVDLNDAEALTQRLGMRSRSLTMQMLHRVQQALAEEDRKLLTEWTLDQTGKEEEGPFPCLWVSPDVTVIDTGSPLLTLEGLSGLHLDCLNAKVMYRGCVKQLNQSKLTGQVEVETPWQAHFGLFLLS
ncbi:hypothetical protein MHYP_G00319700 [Metynnis hypsauchen]